MKAVFAVSILGLSTRSNSMTTTATQSIRHVARAKCVLASVLDSAQRRGLDGLALIAAVLNFQAATALAFEDKI